MIYEVFIDGTYAGICDAGSEDGAGRSLSLQKSEDGKNWILKGKTPPAIVIIKPAYYVTKEDMDKLQTPSPPPAEEKPGAWWECRCGCHRNPGMMHCGPCCSKCFTCGMDVVGDMQAHNKELHPPASSPQKLNEDDPMGLFGSA